MSVPRPAPDLPVRPVLKPALRPLWRDPGTLQLGADPGRALVLTGLDPADRRVIERLDGSRDLDALAGDADLGCSGERVRDLIGVLARGGALEDAADPQPLLDPTNPLAPDLLSVSLVEPAPGAAARTMAGRAATEVEVYGAGRTGATLAALLVASGVGQVRLEDDGPLRQCDLAPGGIRVMRQSSRGAAAAAVVRSLEPGEPSPPPARSIVVLAPAASVIPPEWLRRVRRRPHLAVLVRDTAAVIGPLVLPGCSPCLRCLELARADRDPAWPALAAQLAGSMRRVEPCDLGLASAAGALTALHLLRWLDRPDAGSPLVAGTLELSLTDLRLRRRSLRGHPGCGCGADQPDQLALDAAVGQRLPIAT